MDLRKLDVLIGQHIFGFTIVDDKMLGRVDKFISKNGAIIALPQYSKHIASAWDVVEKIKARNSEIFCLNFYYEKWHCGFERLHHDYIENEVSNESAPLAICLAALKAKNIDVSEWES